MFDIAWSEMIVIGAVALIAIGPKDLPKALRAVGAMTAKARRMASEFQDHFREAMREAELESVKQEVANLNQDLAAATSGLQGEFNSIGSQMPEASQPTSQAAGEATEVDIPGLPPVAVKPAEAAAVTTLSVEAQPGSVTVTETVAAPVQEKPARKKRVAARPKAKIEASREARTHSADAGAPAASGPEPVLPESSRSEPSLPESARLKSPRKRAPKAISSGDDQAA